MRTPIRPALRGTTFVLMLLALFGCDRGPSEKEIVAAWDALNAEYGCANIVRITEFKVREVKRTGPKAVVTMQTTGVYTGRLSNGDIALGNRGSCVGIYRRDRNPVTEVNNKMPMVKDSAGWRLDNELLKQRHIIY